MPPHEKQPRGATAATSRDRAVRQLAKALGEVIEANLHSGRARQARLATAEFYLTAALEAVDAPEPEDEPEHEEEVNAGLTE